MTTLQYMATPYRELCEAVMRQSSRWTKLPGVRRVGVGVSFGDEEQYYLVVVLREDISEGDAAAVREALSREQSIALPDGTEVSLPVAIEKGYTMECAKREEGAK